VCHRAGRGQLKEGRRRKREGGRLDRIEAY
jgi:hypothetical protein